MRARVRSDAGNRAGIPVIQFAERGGAFSLHDEWKNVFSLSAACTIDVVFLSARYQYLVAALHS
jgi:hypothetical protein